MTAGELLAGWCSTLLWEDIPFPLQAKAQDHLLDTIGAAIAGRTTEAVRLAETVFDMPGPSRLLTGGPAREMRHAARINAVASHALEFDDTEGCDHSGAVVVPVLLAILDAHPAVSGSRLLTALVAGYEVGRRVQLALGGYNAHNDSGWHSTATCGVFAATAAAAVLLELDAGQTASALGIAASSSSGGWAFARDGAMTKQLHTSNAAANGIDAALLARAGATGPRDIFEPVWGSFFQTHGNPHVAPAELTKELGTTWHFGHSAIKPYASCRSSHSAIDAALALMSYHQLQPADIISIEIEVNPFLIPMICPSWIPTTSAARMSLPVCLALLMEGKTLAPADFDLYASPETAAWLGRIKVIDDGSAPDVEPLVRINTGQHSFARRHEKARGGETLPLDLAEIETKFDDLVAGHVTTTEAQAIKDFIRQLPGVKSPQFPHCS